MLIETGQEAARTHRRRRLLLGLLLPVLLVAAVSPSSALAQSPSCRAEVRSTQDVEVAAFSLDCDPTRIRSAQVRTTRSGSVDENTGTRCSPDGRDTEFTCEPTSASSLVTARFRATAGEICDDRRLEMRFRVETEPSGAVVEVSRRVSDCAAQSGGGGENAGTSGDDGDVPRGGVDTGAGGAQRGGGQTTAVLPIGGLGLAALALGVGGLVLRRRRNTP